MDVLHLCHLFLFAAFDWDNCGGRYIPVNQDPQCRDEDQRRQEDVNDFRS